MARYEIINNANPHDSNYITFEFDADNYIISGHISNLNVDNNYYVDLRERNCHRIKAGRRTALWKRYPQAVGLTKEDTFWRTYYVDSDNIYIDKNNNNFTIYLPGSLLKTQWVPYSRPSGIKRFMDRQEIIFRYKIFLYGSKTIDSVPHPERPGDTIGVPRIYHSNSVELRVYVTPEELGWR